MIFEQGDIIALELPFSNLVGSKLRPTLVVSHEEFNIKSLDLIVLKITGSSFKSPWETKISNKDLEKGKLKKASYIDAGFIFTIEKEIVQTKIAKIKESRLNAVLEKMKIVFGFSN